MSCFVHHNRSHPHFIADAIVPMCFDCPFNFLSINLISKDKEYR